MRTKGIRNLGILSELKLLTHHGIVGGVLELAYYRAAGEEQASPQRVLPGFRLSS